MEEIILTATDGMVYALKSDHSIYGKEIHLAKNDSLDNWEEIIEPIKIEQNII
jgi:hypothetical protein